MTISLKGRDDQVVRFVGAFGQATARQIYEAIFAPVTETPRDRALKRLTDRRYLSRIATERLSGGEHGGSGPFVYQLGPAGHREYFDTPYKPKRWVDKHALGVVDVYLVFHRLHKAGVMRVELFRTVPNSWAKVGGVDLRPDIHTRVAWPSGKFVEYWIEYDRSTEWANQLRGKLQAYLKAFQEYGSIGHEGDLERWPTFPQTIWVAKDAVREKELNLLIKEHPHGYAVIDNSGRRKPLFGVTTIDKLTELLTQ